MTMEMMRGRRVEVSPLGLGPRDVGGVVRRETLLLMIAFLSLTSLAAGQEFNPATGHHYYRTEVSVPFFVGRAQAFAIGAHLVSLNDAAEDEWVSTTFPGQKWIGLTDETVEGLWQWDSGEPLDYTNWQSGPSTSAFQNYAVSEGFLAGWDPDRSMSPTFNAKFAVIESEVPFGSTIQGLSYTASLPTITFGWSNPESYTSIEVYRGTELLAELPGNATSYQAPADRETRYWFLPRGGTDLARPVTVAVIPESLAIAIEHVVMGEGQVGEVRTFLMNDIEVNGYSYGVCYDPAVLELVSVSPGAIEQSVEPAPFVDFHSINIEPEGFTVGMVLFGAGLTYVSVGFAHETEIATYQVIAPAPITTTLDFCMIGSPQVAHCVIPYSSGACATAEFIPGSVTVVPSFRRGDANGDGLIDLADPVHHLRHLFVGAPAPCRSALDSNDDGSVNLADPIYTLIFLFEDGADPPSPGVECGPDPTLDGLECLNPQGCP
ncbi:MAG: lectin-like protein [Planctomycetota bacterium]